MNNKPNHGGSPNPWGVSAGPMEQWMAAVRAWTEMWMTFAPGMRGGQWPNPWQQPWSGGGTGFRGGSVLPSVSVRVTSQRQTEVEANLTPGAEYGSLVADVHGLSGLTITREAGKVFVNLDVGADQPGGHYHGCIRADGREVGSLVVKIAESSGVAGAARGRRGKSV